MSCKVLLTGISGWIGKHIAIQLLKEGHHVVGTVRNENLIEPTKETLKSKNTPLDNLSFVVLDLLKDEGWDEAAMKAGRADAAVQTFFGAKEHEEKTGGAFEVTDPKLMPKETVNVVGIGFRKSDEEFRQAFNAALAKVMANPATMLERAGKYGYDKAQLPPADMTTEWACSTK